MEPFSLDWLSDTYRLGRIDGAAIVARGQSNPLGVMRVRSEWGEYGVKQYPEPPRATALAVEAAAFQAGFPMPAPVYTVNGSRVADCLNQGRTTWVLVYAWVDGEPYDWHTVDPHVSELVGALLARLHHTPIDANVLGEELWSPLGRVGWGEFAAQAEDSRVEWAPLLAEKVSALVAWEDFIQAHMVHDEPPAPSQRDLHPPNVIRCATGGHAVVDWDAAGPAIAREEVAKYAFVWATDEAGSVSPSAVQAFIAGYRAAGGHYASRGVADLMQGKSSLLDWIAYNVRRHIQDQPGPNPWLPPALLSGVQTPDIEEMERLARMLNV
jgi:aminoglycoside phosphotransferase (APT) family kinase protein